ncbi:MAG TPA: DUF2652 domain-containing protein [Casimicrobiaceae bacterium]|jgi:hypothetical protein|nr:DUF2652 domain-containing protein [Casimicrobiaceae bacterium]
MAAAPSLLVIADIAGYTRFLKLHTVSALHAQHTIGKLLEAVIAAVKPDLALAKLEGDAAFFHARTPRDDATLSRLATAIHRAFHRTRVDLAQNTMCPCDGCQQAGDLKIKVVAHLGEATRQKIAKRDELAGVDVILVHRMLKNDVPIAEYLLVTPPLLPHLAPAAREAATALPLELEGFGAVDAWYVGLASPAADETPPKLSWLRRRARQFALALRTLPQLATRRAPCEGFRNVDLSPP